MNPVVIWRLMHVSPSKPKHPCNWIGCNKLTATRFCPDHEVKYKYDIELHRKSSSERGYTHQWNRASKAFLSRPENALCAECLRKDKIRASSCVDHIIPHKGNAILFWDVSNWQPMCAACHSAKTAREEGGYGNRTESAV